jgi:hypothetical protein
MPLAPTGSGFVDVHGPAGAQVQVGHTAYHAAPVRIELPEGDYLVQLRFRVGKRFRVVHRPAHVVAGQVVTLR